MNLFLLSYCGYLVALFARFLLFPLILVYPDYYLFCLSMMGLVGYGLW
jgi:hypothetical protein